MSRTIKFRAWDQNGWYEDEDAEYPNGVGYMISWERLLEGGPQHVWDTVTAGPHSAKIPMQFTGLLDKNGKEIYEGDVVRCEPNEWLETIGVIKFVICEFVVEQEKPRLHHRIVNGMKGKLEVIGNIYENPNLVS